MAQMSKTAIKFRKIIHKSLMSGFRNAVNKPIKLIRDESERNGNPTIYVAAHVFYDDIPVICSCIKENAYILHGQPKELRKTSLVDYWGLLLNGIIPFDRDDRKGRAMSKIEMAKVLKNGGNILVFCEGTWNFSPNLLVLPLSWGILDTIGLVGKNVNIVPVACDLVENDYCVIIGENLELKSQAEYSKKDLIQTLRDKISTLVWELYEIKPVLQRNTLTDFPDEYWADYIKECCSEIAIRNQHKEDMYVYRPKGIINIDELLADMHGIEYRSLAADFETYKKILKIYNNWVRPICWRNT